MTKLSIDIETYSECPISAGVYRYSSDPSFEVLLFAYSIDGGPVKVVDVKAGERIPPMVMRALNDPYVEKWAFNAQFERVCLSRFMRFPEGWFLWPEGWKCSMTWGATLGLPFSLKEMGAALGIEKQKLEEGKSLIARFCVPCRPTKKNGGRTRNLPEHDPEGWATFKEYNRRDVEAEMAIQERLSKFPVPDSLWKEYWACEEVNDLGVAIDPDLPGKCMEIDAICREKALKELQNLTELANPNSVAQLKRWLLDNDVDAPSLGKKEVSELLSGCGDDTVRRVLELRQLTSKSSLKKYEAMKACACPDGRVRGMFRFYGANRTGRFSSKFIQLQNLPQNHLPDLEQARALAVKGDVDALETLYGNVPDVLSQLVRTAFVPSEGHRFLVADYSAIEARVIAWLAGEKWRLELFENDGDIYCASASRMFGVPVEKHGANSHLRQKGKIAELALGYGGSVGALTAMGALELGLKEDELKPLVDAWRTANPAIVGFWWEVDSCVRKAIKEGGPVYLGPLAFECRSKCLFITLPSGRKLAYPKPCVTEGGITYVGLTPAKKWGRIESYGPKFVENIVQATARDLLVNAILNLKGKGVCMHIHDEAVVDAAEDVALDEVITAMESKPEWAEGLPLKAAGYECPFYKKD